MLGIVSESMGDFGLYCLPNRGIKPVRVTKLRLQELDVFVVPSPVWLASPRPCSLQTVFLRHPADTSIDRNYRIAEYHRHASARLFSPKADAYGTQCRFGFG